MERTTRNPPYTDFEDTLGETRAVTLPHGTPGTDPERFRAKATAYLRAHEDHIALQRLRRNRQLTSEDVSALEQMLIEAGTEAADVEAAARRAGGLGVFVRSLVGLERTAAVEAFGHFLDGSRLSVEQVRFINLIVDELTAHGVMAPSRLFESPYTDHAPTGPDWMFQDEDVEVIVEILGSVRRTAEAGEAS